MKSPNQAHLSHVLHRNFACLFVLLLFFVWNPGSPLVGQEVTVDKAKLKKSIDRGANWLIDNQLILQKYI